jgi:hypothetical protein
MDPDPELAPDPALFDTDLQDDNKKIILLSNFNAYFLFEGTCTSFFKIKSHKKLQNSRN